MEHLDENEFENDFASIYLDFMANIIRHTFLGHKLPPFRSDLKQKKPQRWARRNYVVHHRGSSLL